MSGTTVFLDRDGVINEDSPDYIKCWADFSFIQSSLDAVARLTRSGWSIIVITNQSAVNRGMIPLAELENMHRRLRRAAGCGRTILVQTGNGKAALRSLD
ncbi:MAG: HAD-IIIA family hydrolase, partial [Desulfosarcina sp.]|nr:HAD-IIIA family hydrolase [Desulfosarcina sp.]